MSASPDLTRVELAFEVELQVDLLSRTVDRRIGLESASWDWMVYGGQRNTLTEKLY